MAMRRFGTRFALAFGLSTWLLFASVAAANTVVQWNAIALSTVIGAEQSPAARLRVMTLVHVAMFEALNFNQSRYRSELVVVPPQALKMADAVIAASAAHHVLVEFYPEWRTSLDNELRLILESTANEQDAWSAKSLGAVIANNILAARSHDVVPGRLDTPAIYPWFIHARVTQVKPPEVNSVRWVRDVTETRSLGGRTSAIRSTDQTSAATFWATFGPLSWNAVVAHLVVTKRLNHVEAARLFALTSMAVSDTYVAISEVQRQYKVKGPLEVLRDDHWAPLVDSRPEYPCAPCAVSTALKVILEAELGTDEVAPFAVNAPMTASAPRRWTRVRDYADEVSAAQINAGTHFRHSTEIGERIGLWIGARALEHLRPRR